MSEGNVISLVKGAPVVADVQPSQEVIEVAQELLERAKAGKLKALAGAAIDDDGFPGYFIVGSMNPTLAIGALEMVKAALIELSATED